MRKKSTYEQITTKGNDLLISTGERSFWQKVLAALLFFGVGLCMYFFFSGLNQDSDGKEALFYSNIGQIAGLLFVCGIRCSLVKDYYFDLECKQYKIVRRVGFIKLGKWKDFEKLGYISVFKNEKDILEINLWYNKNKHFNLGQGENLEIALSAGRKIAEKLHIDLLDAATNPQESKWVLLSEAV